MHVTADASCSRARVAGNSFINCNHLPKGVKGRNSDNTLIKKYLNWEPNIRLKDGLEKTYRWINDQMTGK